MYKICLELQEGRNATLANYRKFDNHIEDISKFLHQFVGVNLSYELANEIAEKIENSNYLHWESKSYRISVEKGKVTLSEETFPIKEMLLKQKGLFEEDEVEEILQFIDTLLTKKWEIWTEGIHFLNQKEYLLSFKNQLKDSLLRVTGERRVQKYIEKFDTYCSEKEDTIYVQIGLNEYYLLKLQKTPILTKSKKSPEEDLCAFLGDFEIINDMLDEFMYGFPRWIPKGFHHIRGNLKTGFVVTDDSSNDYVYIPDHNVYMSCKPIGFVTYKYMEDFGIDEIKLELEEKARNWNENGKNYYINSSEFSTNFQVPYPSELYTLPIPIFLNFCNEVFFGATFCSEKCRFTITDKTVYNVDFSDGNYIYSPDGFCMRVSDPHPDPLDAAYGTKSFVNKFSRIRITDASKVEYDSCLQIDADQKILSVRGFLVSKRDEVMEEWRKSEYQKILQEMKQNVFI